MEASPASTSRIDTLRWRAVVGRSRSQDGAFVYAVRTTGIYCRPSCPARRPERENVTFFPDAQAAERAGYRPCRRCRPAAPTDASADVVVRACVFIEAHLDEALSLQTLGRAVKSSPHHLQRVFKERTGLTPAQWIGARRTEALKECIRKAPSVTDALYAAGYGSPSRLYEKSTSRLGMTPAAYRRGGRGERIGYAVVSSPYGRLLIAATAKGVCRVALGESVAALARALGDEFPHALLERDPAVADLLAPRVLEVVRGRERDPSIPLDLRTSAFRFRVFHALCRIPRGETRSYGEIATQLGRPRAARGVARAVASNPAALLVPCHRVIGADGSLRGYRWGIERKRKLLEAEKNETAADRRPRRRGHKESRGKKAR